MKRKLIRLLQKFYLFPAPKVVESIAPKWKWLSKLGINTIINIGSNEGQFALDLRKYIPKAKIYAFEPLPDPFKILCAKFENDSNFTAFPFALGKDEGIVDMYLNEYSPSSSLLKMDDNHKKHFDFAKNEFQVKVDIKKLDDVAFQFEILKPLLVTIDVQGFELDVINGGLETIRKADVIITEVSFTSLYKGQPLFDELYATITSLDFEYAGNFEQLISPVNDAILQADAIFVKKKSS